MSRNIAVMIVVVAAISVGITGLFWGTHSAGGADPYGYVSQADLWTRGELLIEHPVAESLPWPEVDATLAPLGYRPGLTPGTIVPVYPAGLPIVMAAFQLVAGPRAVFWVVPLFGMLAVGAAGALALRLSGPTGGSLAALLLATSPTLLFSVTWPMSDAVSAGWWGLMALCVTRSGVRSAGIAGVASAFAVMTRPNLVGVALVPFAYLGLRALRRRTREDLTSLMLFSALTATGCLVVAGLHTFLYGSFLASGYGDLNALFETSRRPYNPDGLMIRPLLNLQGFFTRPMEVEPVLVVLGLVGGFAVLGPWGFSSGADRGTGDALTPHHTRPDPDARWAGRHCLGVVGLVLASYLFFRSYPEWWYLRLLLPAYPALAVLAGIGIVWVTDRLRAPIRVTLVASLSVFVIYTGIKEAFDRDVYRSRQNEARYEAVGQFVADQLPENAVFFAAQHSGSLRYYADRLTIRFDTLHGEWLEQATAAIRELGYEPYYVVEGPERRVFNQRFAGVSRLGALGWTPVAEFRGPTSVWIFRPADHPAFGGGEPPVTRLIDLTD